MINQLLNPYIFNPQESQCITIALSNWNSQKKCIIELKEKLNNHFDFHQQEKCCFCGLLYDRTGRGEIEHIAPKGSELFPQFSYISNNLAKACQLCNSSTMKHTYDSVETVDEIYELCKFKIVHPYLDDHNYHYSWNYGIQEVLISINNNSEKAKESIRLFELNSVKRTRARAQQRNQEKINNFFNTSRDIKNRIKAVLKFKI
ncbi:MAG: hypothetical protein Q8K70_11320 [Bacteroidota bacterium]|nr:hypothetical protein [Bacteroidota bacterium]